MNERINNKSTHVLFWTSLILSWLTFIFFFTVPFGLLFWLIALTILFLRKSKLKWYLIGLSAWTLIPAYSFLSGTKDYFAGQGTFEYVGLPDPEFYNLDRKYRVRNSTYGCIVLGFEPLTQVPNNWAIELWTNVFGYQKGSYKGFYPDKEQTSSLLDSVRQKMNFVKSETFFNFSLHGKNYQIAETEHRDMQKLDSCNLAKVIIDKELIIFKPCVSSDEQVTYLADKETGNVFATYYECIKEDTNR